MTPTDFIRKWSPGGTAHELNERAGAQPHFIDLCRLLGVPEPADPERYCFERGLVKTGSAAARSDGFADVWLRGHFAWEYKRPGRSLKEALKQLMLYALPLENPPLLVVSDRLRIEVHTHFTGTPSECHVFALADLADAELRQRLRTLWTQPDAWRPRRSNRDITEAAAQTFAGTAARLRAAGVAPEQVSHFLTQCLLCFFAEDVGLLPERLFERLVGVMITPERLRSQLTRLFETMRDGGLFGVDDLPWFNGGLFKTIAVPPLDAADVAALKAASAMNWSAIDPSIFGTLFERGLDPAVRAALGANYTDPATIQRLVEPVVQRPLLAEWSGPGGAKERIAAAMARSKRHGDKAWRDAQAAFVGFLERLRGFRVLDAACGSGNFLYLALKALKDIEHLANHEAEALGLERQHDVTGPHNVLGIELNEYAAELARVTVWIGELQWRIQRGYAFKTHPVLEPLDHIECRDALMTPQGEEAAWPAVDVLVGNPPFVGDKKMRGELGAEYTERLRRLYQGRVPGGADLVCYWFEKARAAIEAGRLQRAGLVSTNSIRGGRNREVLDRICTSTRIFEAWSDEPWVNDGAAVRVSLVGFGQSPQAALLDGKAVHRIGPELAEIREGGASLSSAVPLTENQSAAYQGPTKGGRFDVPGDTCRGWLVEPTLGTRPIWTVLKPWANGDAVTSRWPDSWIIDFNDMPADQAALLEQPFDWVVRLVKPERDGNAEKRTREMFWQFKRLGTDCREAIKSLSTYIATPEVSKHRVFVLLPSSVAPDKNLVVVARADYTTFGVLQSRIHEVWALQQGTSLEDRPRYTSKSTFRTFPFPTGLTPADTAHQRTEALDGGALIPAELPAALRPHAEAIARAAQRLVTLRDAWLNPPEWTERVPEIVPLGLTTSPYPDRVVAKPGFEKELAKRTLTNLYNQRPAWLAQAHAALDRAVATAYGWSEDPATLSDDEILRRLLGVNRERAGGEA
ncbi:MAG TPA: hypothetical protein PK797_09600 [Burkholderiaceae bacterium]|nr:hypothetical protein [Burkholderiaceae bacterium]